LVFLSCKGETFVSGYKPAKTSKAKALSLYQQFTAQSKNHSTVQIQIQNNSKSKHIKPAKPSISQIDGELAGWQSKKNLSF
jgi:hypothetical protein